jgi:hypothetical protein
MGDLHKNQQGISALHSTVKLEKWCKGTEEKHTRSATNTAKNLIIPAK